MADWNSSLYLKFEKERTQPAIDLANRINVVAPKRIVDLGCGPGNSTAQLKKRFPTAEILGVDSSPNMIEKAKTDYPELEFEVLDVNGDLSAFNGQFDVVFSNACLQWLPDHQTLLPKLMKLLKKGGELAVQMPENKDERLFQIVDEVAEDKKWGFDTNISEGNIIPAPSEYFDILSSCSTDFSIGETYYHHEMPDAEAMLDWIRSTRLRPYLNALDDGKKSEFEAEILKQTKKDYQLQKNGHMILKFKRLFFVAKK